MIRNTMSGDNMQPGTDRPSKVALYTYNFLKQSNKFKKTKDIYILNIGCGEGRDARFLVKDLPCHILGIDSSEKTIAAAQLSLTGDMAKHIEFLCFDYKNLRDKFDIILVSNMYQYLEQTERAEFRKTVQRCLKSEGMLFLSTWSLRGSDHDTNNTNIGSYDIKLISDSEKQNLYFATREELETEFNFLNISALFEFENDDEYRDENHHHISWMLVGIPR